jgi:hypothetical protein
LRKTFSEKTAEQTQLKEEAEVMERRLIAAEKLIAGRGLHSSTSHLNLNRF